MMPAHDRGSAAGRNRYADLLRLLAIAAVVAGHWLLTSVTYRDGQLSGLHAIRYVSWGGWVTLVFQVMPVFFLVGGHVHAISWTGRRERGEGWARWVREHAMGLLWPTTVYVAAMVLAVAVARAAGVGPAELARGRRWLVALQLWFLPVYLPLIAMTPVMLAAHRRWGLAVPAVMALAALVTGRPGGRPRHRRVRPDQARDRRLCPRRQAAALVLAAYAGGLLLTLLSGPPSPERGPRPQEPGAAPQRAGPGPPAPVVTAPPV